VAGTACAGMVACRTSGANTLGAAVAVGELEGTATGTVGLADAGPATADGLPLQPTKADATTKAPITERRRRRA